jgi:hypothetical protein
VEGMAAPSTLDGEASDGTAQRKHRGNAAHSTLSPGGGEKNLFDRDELAKTRRSTIFSHFRVVDAAAIRLNPGPAVLESALPGA